jgi:aspartyl-tRNA(Asn)/glutamyl-tRNA(Gln) amidotransferase subunit A
MARFMASHDLLLTPTVSALPFPIDRDGSGMIDGRRIDDDAWTPTAFPANLTGQPVASEPAGMSRSGRPVGLHIMGRHLADPTVLRAAAAIERARPWHHLQPQRSTPSIS